MSPSSKDILPLTVAIPTFGREQVLIDTISMLLSQRPAASEILVLDQTVTHEANTVERLESWAAQGHIVWKRLSIASQPVALNVALRIAKEQMVLFLDDDIRVEPGFLKAHVDAFSTEEIWAVAGQVLQPGEVPDEEYQHIPSHGPFADFDFRFRSNQKAIIKNGMSGNLCVRKDRAIDVGGFDENFLPPVAFRFDNEFCKRLTRSGGQIAFEPTARIYHLRASRGGTRSNSNHLKSMSPEHGVGDYYFALTQASSSGFLAYSIRRMFREIRTKFHLTHPWWIPVKLIGECRAFLLAIQLRKAGAKTIARDKS